MARLEAGPWGTKFIQFGNFYFFFNENGEVLNLRKSTHHGGGADKHPSFLIFPIE